MKNRGKLIPISGACKSMPKEGSVIMADKPLGTWTFHLDRTVAWCLNRLHGNLDWGGESDSSDFGFCTLSYGRPQRLPVGGGNNWRVAKSGAHLRAFAHHFYAQTGRICRWSARWWYLEWCDDVRQVWMGEVEVSRMRKVGVRRYRCAWVGIMVWVKADGSGSELWWPWIRMKENGRWWQRVGVTVDGSGRWKGAKVAVHGSKSWVKRWEWAAWQVWADLGGWKLTEVGRQELMEVGSSW